MSAIDPAAPPPAPRPFYRVLYFQVLAGVLIGALLGHFFPDLGKEMKPLGDAFIKLVKMLIAPIIFITVVGGIAAIDDLRNLGRVGLKSLVYFEAVTTIALAIGMIVVKTLRPGDGIHVLASTQDLQQAAKFAEQGGSRSVIDHILAIIPDTIVGAFARGEILQVLFISILSGLALSKLGKPGKALLDLLEQAGRALFIIIGFIMKVAPIGAFGAMAYTIGNFGIDTLLPLMRVILCVYITCGLFVVFILGAIARASRISLWRFLRYIREEIFIVLGTSSSESVLPRMMTKLENLGCSRSVVRLVLPSGYSFNLDGTCIYLTIAALFLAQASGTHLTLGEELQVLAILLLTSKGAAGVTGSGFITLAATLSSTKIPVESLALLLGVDRFMSEARAITNLIGNGIATVVIARWEGEFDAERARRVLGGAAGVEGGGEPEAPEAVPE